MDAPFRVANFRTKLEAETAAGLLEEARIPYLIQSSEGMLYGPLPPGATLYVAGENADRARAILCDAGVSVDDEPTPPSTEGR